VKVLVDTCVWSLALRRAAQDLGTDETLAVGELRELVSEGRASLIGPIRQELLSGIRRTEDFEQLRVRLGAFEDTPVTRDDYERAASFFNQCRAKGIAGTPSEVLICATAAHYDWPIFSTDQDFELYAQHLPIRLHQPREAGA
jgi:predicted nucleic acid-binding protein